MKFESKFDIGEEVYFYDINKQAICKGTIKSIDLSHYNESTDWRYFILPGQQEGEPFALGSIAREQFIFRNREDIFEFAYKLTEKL